MAPSLGRKSFIQRLLNEVISGGAHTGHKE